LTGVIPDDSAVASHSTDTLFAVLYDELKRVARRELYAADPRATLRTTELVHEAFLKLGRASDVSWEGRAHFFGTASRAMRQVLVDFARRRLAAKRGGNQRMVSLGEASGVDASAALDLELGDLLDLDAALDRLDRVGPRLRQVVELRFFGGVPDVEIARLLGLSVRTVERDWLKARLFLLREMERAPNAT
jgi:RNA polymerase sigma factor (TIGR02999 family)